MSSAVELHDSGKLSDDAFADYERIYTTSYGADEELQPQDVLSFLKRIYGGITMKKCLSVFLMLSLVFLIILSAACDNKNGDAQGNTRNGGISIVNTPDGAMMYKFEYIDLLTDDDYLIEYNIGNPSLEAGKSWNNSLYFLSGHMGKAADGYNHAQQILTVYDEQANMLVNTGITNMLEITDNLQYAFYFIAPISDTEYVALCSKQTARIPRDADRFV